jgi:hypothetical protein
MMTINSDGLPSDPLRAGFDGELQRSEATRDAA